MKLSDELTALIFELQRAPGPADKARALARAWRTVRRLDGTERRLLAREFGFDGAEELVEGLAGKSRGTFAPAAVLEALGRMRKDPNLSLVGILTDLKGPDRREDLLMRGIDLVAGDDDDVDDDHRDGFGSADDAVVFRQDEVASTEEVNGAEEPGEVVVQEIGSNEDHELSAGRKPPPLQRPVETVADPGRLHPSSDPEPEPEPSVEEKDPSTWDRMWTEESSGAIVAEVGGRDVVTRALSAGRSESEQTDSVLQRLHNFRGRIGEFGKAGKTSVTGALETFPERWAKRRALVALIESGVPDDTASTLDLIENLDRSMDRQWCLSTLARRGDLGGDDLERALEMLASPGAKRRFERLADRAG